MRVSRLELTDFRNYERAVLELDAGATLLIGRNGQGKTNMVESLVVLASGSSHRVPNDQALIRAGEARAIVRTRLTNGERTIPVDLEINREGSNRAQAAGSPVRMRDLPRYLQAVLFSPEDLAIVRGDPGGRRRFLDDLLVASSPRMGSVVADLDRVLKQRNSLLKSARASRLRAEELTTLDVWDERLVTLGGELLAARRRLIDEMRDDVRAAYRIVAGDDHELTLELATDVPSDSAEYRSALRALRGKELERAVSLLGPHRDELVLELNGLLARHYASHGESWSIALALKLASAQRIRHDVAGDPVVILDDVFAELDAGRRERLAEAVSQFEQVLITAAVDDDVPEVLGGRRVRIAAGTIVEDAGQPEESAGPATPAQPESPDHG